MLWLSRASPGFCLIGFARVYEEFCLFRLCLVCIRLLASWPYIAGTWLSLRWFLCVCLIACSYGLIPSGIGLLPPGFGLFCARPWQVWLHSLSVELRQIWTFDVTSTICSHGIYAFSDRHGMIRFFGFSLGFSASRFLAFVAIHDSS